MGSGKISKEDDLNIKGMVDMKKILRLLFSIFVGVLVITPLAACQPAPTPIPPTLTPLPTTTPTITPTPLPREMGVDDFISECAVLDEQDAIVILSGMVFLPDSTIYGYEGWYGVDFITTDRTRVLFGIGSGTNQMEELPQFFHEQDLAIHDDTDRLIRHGHMVRVTGRPKYRADSENRRCELFVDKVDSMMPEGVLTPIDVTIDELNDGDLVDDCGEFEFSRQMVRLSGSLHVDKTVSSCFLGYCRVVFDHPTKYCPVNILEGEGPNRMSTLPEPFSNSDLVIYNKNGNIIDNTSVSLVGVVKKAAFENTNYCEMIVYEIESPPQE